MKGRPITAVVAVLFAALTVAAYGSGTGPGTTASSGADELSPSRDTAAAIRHVQTPGQELPAPAPQPAVQPTTPAAVPQAPADDPAPAQRPTRKPAHKSHEGDDEGDDEQGDGHGLGDTYCQSLKGTGGPAFGHCIAAKAHELHGLGKHR
jgi:hypothetical protein